MGAKLPNVRLAEPPAEHIDRSMGSVKVKTFQVTQGGLSRSVGVQNDPTLVPPNSPVDATQNSSVVSYEVDINEARTVSVGISAYDTSALL